MKRMWKYFREIAHIPHGSENEEAMTEYLVHFAKKQELEYIQEPCGNVIIKSPGTKGKEQNPGVILQCHMDMVCEKNENSTHDFTKDRLQLIVHDNWISADGTTLGADNGIGLVMALSILSAEDIEHPPLEVLFTVAEETGMTGARELDPSHIKGSRLINLDSEDEGVLYTGCAGGIRLYTKGMLETEKSRDDQQFWELTIKGFSGGHSGMNIIENRGNPILLGATLMETLCNAVPSLQLSSAKAGGKDNAIPRESFIQFATDQGSSLESLWANISDQADSMLRDFQKTDPHGTIEIHPKEKTEYLCTREDTELLCSTVKEIPHGVVAMSSTLEGIVETSTNLASITFEHGSFEIHTSQRSFIWEEREAITEKVRKSLMPLGGKIVEESPYPGWEPNPNSELTSIITDLYKEETGRNMEITAVHAGLECGLLKDKLPHLDCVSLGPDIEDVHTPSERASIVSANRVAHFLLTLLAKL